MTLYNVRADDWDGTPHGNDLFVRAENPQDAVKHWQIYYGVDDELPDSVDDDAVREFENTTLDEDQKSSSRAIEMHGTTAIMIWEIRYLNH